MLVCHYKRKSHLGIFLATTILLLAFVCTANGEQKYFVHASGYGPVKIGMTVIEASKALGLSLIPAYLLDKDDKNCHYVYPNGDHNHIGFLVEDGLIARVDVRSNYCATDSGITVGQDEIVVREKYKNRITEKIHPYVGDEGKYLIIDTIEGYQLIFETYRGKITSFRTGKLPSVAYIEGCL